MNIVNIVNHKLTTKLVTEFELIGIEDLNVKGMVKNHCLARAVSDAGFFEFRRQLEYKSAMTGSKVIIAVAAKLNGTTDVTQLVGWAGVLLPARAIGSAWANDTAVCPPYSDYITQPLRGNL